MEKLIKACRFAAEESFGALELSPVKCVTKEGLESLHALIGKGHAKMTPVGGENVSVVVNERHQGDVDTLFCGARSLIIHKGTGEIQVRGINKFFSLIDIGVDWVRDSSLWSCCESISAQRKMAGFSVNIFSSDGLSLSVMSKHSLDGPHVLIAKRILDFSVSLAFQREMARDLFALDATASCECISLEDDPFHPTMENKAYDQHLVLYAIQRNQLAEISLCDSGVLSYSKKWGILCVPQKRISTVEVLQQVIQIVTSEWSPRLDFCSENEEEVVGEGVVLVLSMASVHDTPLPKLDDQKSGEEREFSDFSSSSQWKKLVRIKVKTPQYIALRRFRSLLLSETPSSALIIHSVLMEWATIYQMNPVEVARSQGVCCLWQQFVDYVEKKSRFLYRDALWCVGQGYHKLVRQTIGEIKSEYEAPIMLVTLCGLPASGKTTVGKNLLKCLGASSFDYGLHINRDVVYRRLECAGSKENTPMSKHQLQQLNRDVHRELIRLLHQVVKLSSFCRKGIIVVFDACNSTPGGRRVWREVLPKVIQKNILVYVECSDEAAVANRLQHRVDHERLKDLEEAQRALYTVRKKFIPPVNSEQFDTVVHVDTSGDLSTLEKDTRMLAELISGLEMLPSDTELRIIGDSHLFNEIQSLTNPIVHSILAVPSFSEATTTWMNDVLSTKKVHRSTPERVIQLVVDKTFEDLQKLAVQTLLISGVDKRKHGGYREGIAKTGLVLEKESLGSRVVLGNTRWLHGWLGATSELGNEIDFDGLYTAFLTRFSRAPAAPHVTLFFNRESEEGDFCAETGLSLGQRVRGLLTHLLIDRYAWIWKVKLLCGDVVVNQWERADNEVNLIRPSNIPLHLTIGCAENVAFTYAGAMEKRFIEWEQADRELALAQRDASAKRSRQKYHNFLELKLDPSIEIWGSVVDASFRD